MVRKLSATHARTSFGEQYQINQISNDKDFPYARASLVAHSPEGVCALHPSKPLRFGAPFCTTRAKCKLVRSLITARNHKLYTYLSTILWSEQTSYLSPKGIQREMRGLHQLNLVSLSAMNCQG
jgi:hypothetical protein